MDVVVGTCLVFFLALLRNIHGYGAGWSSAHATFYGGGDASGTMGKDSIIQKQIC